MKYVIEVEGDGNGREWWARLYVVENFASTDAAYEQKLQVNGAQRTSGTFGRAVFNMMRRARKQFFGGAEC